ncbi:MAG: M23 family metallopeptidase [Deltaproteobacteria bacterium]|nr:M23 family metallopeptidase [Deltaproteobacteria bacterium]MBW2361501.1 M23 family metallopeptidase [Deltaproteobacteria bacterium]
MERYSLIVVADETAPIRRFDVRKTVVRRACQAAALVAALALLGLVDYVRVRVEHPELARLRVENAEQRATIESFDEKVAGVSAALRRVEEFERKVRIIANLPGSVAATGDDVMPTGAGADLSGLAGGGIDVEAVPAELPPLDSLGGEEAAPADAAARIVEDERTVRLEIEALRLTRVADQRRLSLEELVAGLEDKGTKLVSSPAVWPTQGWLTSRFGTRVSPFTGKRQFHAGIDVAGAAGSDVIATADGKVVYAGKKGPMGNAVILDHGYGLRTHYGHNREVAVKKGERVERGQKIASLGNSGRSTGPHLHYTVELNGKAVNPLDYIFD